MKRQQRRERGRHRWLRQGRAIAGDALAEVLDRIARASVVVAEVLGRFGMAVDNYARSVAGAAAAGSELINEMSTLDDLAFAFFNVPIGLPVTEPGPEPDAALRLAYDTPLLPEQARSLIREHGLEFAERVGEMMTRGLSFEEAEVAILGNLGPGAMAAVAMMRMRQTEPVTINPSGPLRGVVGIGPGGAYFKRAPRHGTPSSFVEVCGDAAVGRVRTACDRCGFYSPPSIGKSLTCALHPLGRPEGRCGDWEDRRTEAAAMARGRAELRAREAYGEAIVRRREAIDAAAQRPECHHYINAAGQAVPELITDGGANPPENMVSDRVLTHESVEVVTEAAYGADGMPTGRLITSRTRYRHCPDGRREIVPEEPVPPPRLSQPWERPGYRWVSIDGDRVEVSLIRDWPIWVLGIDPAPPEELRNGRVFGVRVVNNGGYSYSKEIPLVSWCSERDRFECSTPAGWRHCFRLSS